MRISDWSSDVCSSDLPADRRGDGIGLQGVAGFDAQQRLALANSLSELARHPDDLTGEARANVRLAFWRDLDPAGHVDKPGDRDGTCPPGFEASGACPLGRDGRAALLGCVGPTAAPPLFR